MYAKWVFKIFGFFSLICLLLIVSADFRVWTDCEYCGNLNLNVPKQKCSGGGASTCSLYYTAGYATCCSNELAGSPLCEDYHSIGTITFSYRQSSGTYCNGYYLCAKRSYSPCQGDFASAYISDCVPYGPTLSFNATGYQCN